MRIFESFIYRCISHYFPMVHYSRNLFKCSSICSSKIQLWFFEKAVIKSYGTPGKLHSTVRQFGKSSYCRENELCAKNSEYPTSQNSNEENNEKRPTIGAHQNSSNSPRIKDGYKLLKDLKIMAVSGIRNDKALGICRVLNSMNLKFDATKYSQLLYCMSVLKIPDEEVIFKILQQVTLGLSSGELSSSIIRSLAKSVEKLLARDTTFLEALTQWNIKHQDTIDPRTCIQTIHTLAVLNYFPSNGDVLITKLKKLNFLDYYKTEEYLDFIWATIILKCAKLETTDSECLQSLQEKLSSALPLECQYSVALKLANIYGVSLQYRPDIYWKKKINQFLYEMKRKRERDMLFRNLIDTLTNLLPHQSFSSLEIRENGCIIDVVCYFLPDGTPTTPAKYMNQSDGIKLAIIVLQFKDLCLPGKKVPNGIISFHEKCLENSGFKVLFIHFDEFPWFENIKTKCQFLRCKIKTKVPNFNVAQYDNQGSDMKSLTT